MTYEYFDSDVVISTRSFSSTSRTWSLNGSLPTPPPHRTIDIFAPLSSKIGSTHSFNVLTSFWMSQLSFSLSLFIMSRTGLLGPSGPSGTASCHLPTLPFRRSSIESKDNLSCDSSSELRTTSSMSSNPRSKFFAKTKFSENEILTS